MLYKIDTNLTPNSYWPWSGDETMDAVREGEPTEYNADGSRQESRMSHGIRKSKIAITYET